MYLHIEYTCQYEDDKVEGCNEEARPVADGKDHLPCQDQWVQVLDYCRTYQVLQTCPGEAHGAG